MDGWIAISSLALGQSLSVSLNWSSISLNLLLSAGLVSRLDLPKSGTLRGSGI